MNYYHIEMNICGAVATSGAHDVTPVDAIKKQVTIAPGKRLKLVEVKSDQYPNWLDEAAVRVCYEYADNGKILLSGWMYFIIVDGVKPLRYNAEGKMIVPHDVREMEEFVDAHIENPYHFWKYFIWKDVQEQINQFNEERRDDDKPNLTEEEEDEVFNKVYNNDYIYGGELTNDAIQDVIGEVVKD